MNAVRILKRINRQLFVTYSGMDTGMTEKHCEVLAKCRVRFVKDLKPDDVLDHLIADLIITSDDQEDIAALKTRKDRVRFILDLLPQRSDRAFYSLKEALNDADSGHRHLYELLDKTLDDVSLPCPVQATGNLSTCILFLIFMSITSYVLICVNAHVKVMQNMQIV